MSREILKRNGNGWQLLALVLGIFVVVMLAVNLTVLRAGDAAEAAAPALPAAVVQVVCTVVNLGVFPARIHVKCVETFDNGSGGPTIQYFAVPTANAANVNRFQSLFSAAFLASKKLYIFYDPMDLSGSSIGCGTSDCRLAQSAIMQ